MAAVGVAAEIGVVLVELHRAAAAARDLPRAFLEQAFARLVLGNEIDERGAFGRRVFGMGVVVVKPSAVAQDEIAFDLLEGEFALAVLGIVAGLVGVLEEFTDAKAAGIAMGVLGGVVPEIGHAVLRGGADERDRFLDDVGLGVFHDRDAQFRFETKADGPGRRGGVHGRGSLDGISVMECYWDGKMGFF